MSWTPERRAQQAARARALKPWRQATGPKTDAGKARTAQNSLKHGQRTRARIEELKRIRYVLRVAAANVAAMNALIALAKAKRTLACHAEAHGRRRIAPQLTLGAPKLGRAKAENAWAVQPSR